MSIKLKDTISDLINNSDKLDGKHAADFALSSHGIHWEGFTKRANTSATWGTLVADNGYTPLLWMNSTGGGGVAFSDAENQTFMQIDGHFYQNEGRYLVLDTNNFSTYAAPKSHTHDDRYFTESEINTKLGNYLPLTGGNLSGNLSLLDNTGSYRRILIGNANGTNTVIHNSAFLGSSRETSISLYDGTTHLGSIGVKSYPFYVDSSAVVHTLYHSGNLNINKLNADTLDGYHESSFWRNDATAKIWAPSTNIYMSPSSNSQEWSFDFRDKGNCTGLYWQVWDETKTTLLRVDADSGIVSAPYGFSGSLSGNASTATALTSNAGSSTLPIYFSGGKPVACGTSLAVSITGTSGKANQLTNTRTIWGQNFNGTGNIASTSDLYVNTIRDSNGIWVMGSDGSGNISIGSAAARHSTRIDSLIHQVLTIKSYGSVESSINFTNKNDKSWVVGINPGRSDNTDDFYCVWSSTAGKIAQMIDTTGTSHFYFNASSGSYSEGLRLYSSTKTSSWSEINFGCDPSVTVGSHDTQWTVGRNGNNNSYVVRNNTSDRYVITTGGLHGINTSSPSYTLHVNGSFYAASGSFGGTASYANSAGSSTTSGALTNLTRATQAAWGTLTSANGYKDLGTWNESDGGGGSWSIQSKGGQISMQIDGEYYANEGKYKVIHEGNISSYIPASSTNADTVDGYHASSLWRSDGGTWNPGSNISLSATANGQEWSFDITRNGKTGCYWHVWDSSLGSMLGVNADNGLVTAYYTFNCAALQIGGQTITFVT